MNYELCPHSGFCFGVSRAAMLAALDMVTSRAQKRAKDKNSSQVSLLAIAPPVETAPIPGIGLDCPEQQIPEMDEAEKLRRELEGYAHQHSGHTGPR